MEDEIGQWFIKLAVIGVVIIVIVVIAFLMGADMRFLGIVTIVCMIVGVWKKFASQRDEFHGV